MRERELNTNDTIFTLSLTSSGGGRLAKLPATIYKEIENLQRELSKNGVALDEAYYYFDRAGYRRTTANKWLLNWAVCKILMFDKDDRGTILKLGYFPHKTDTECLNGVWLPVKEVIGRNAVRL